MGVSGTILRYIQLPSLIELKLAAGRGNQLVDDGLPQRPQVADRQRWHASKKYRDIATSELTMEVVEPTESIEIDLQWNGGKPFIERSGRAGGD